MNESTTKFSSIMIVSPSFSGSGRVMEMRDRAEPLRFRIKEETIRLLRRPIRQTKPTIGTVSLSDSPRSLSKLNDVPGKSAASSRISVSTCEANAPRLSSKRAPPKNLSFFFPWAET